jgi:DNA-binding transcriptional MerR regulator
MAKKLGFSLKEIQELFAITHAEDFDRERIRAVAEIKSQEIQEKLVQLNQMKAVLDDLILKCRQGEKVDPCPIASCLMKKIN